MAYNGLIVHLDNQFYAAKTGMLRAAKALSLGRAPTGHRQQRRRQRDTETETDDSGDKKSR
ncbi:hypothetical protein E4U55_000182 [Claviceps digitariae]|nr:hypothetical protein E4U55_000182 [Claviceps digitariae]